MRAVVAGATGLVGSHLVDELIRDAHCSDIVVLTRRPLQQKHSKIKEIIISDLSEILNHTKDLAGDVFFCCLGTTIKTAGSREAFEKVDLIAVRDFAEVAKWNKAQTFVMVSASGANSNSQIYYSRVKGQAEKAVEGAAPRVLIFRPSLLIGQRTENRPGEHFLIRTFSVLGPFMPRSLANRVATSVPVLARRMREKSFQSSSPGRTVIEAKELGE